MQVALRTNMVGCTYTANESPWRSICIYQRITLQWLASTAKKQGRTFSIQLWSTRVQGKCTLPAGGENCTRRKSDRNKKGENRFLKCIFALNEIILNWCCINYNEQIL